MKQIIFVSSKIFVQAISLDYVCSNSFHRRPVILVETSQIFHVGSLRVALMLTRRLHVAKFTFDTLLGQRHFFGPKLICLCYSGLISDFPENSDLSTSSITPSMSRLSAKGHHVGYEILQQVITSQH